MNFFFRLSYWGYLLLGFGLLLLIDQFYPLRLPYGAIFWAVILISLGIQLLVMPKNTKNWHFGKDFSSIKTKVDGEKSEDNIIFGKGVLDYSDLTNKNQRKSIDVSIVFAQGTIQINPQDPIQIKASATFGNVTLPDGKSVSFGERIYQTESFSGSANPIFMRVDVVFGEGIITEKLP